MIKKNEFGRASLVVQEIRLNLVDRLTESEGCVETAGPALVPSQAIA